MFPMIVMAAIDVNAATSEELPQFMKYMNAPFPLNNCKRWLNLPANTFVSLVPEDWNTEAAFTVNKADDPLLDSWPFLLIVRT